MPKKNYDGKRFNHYIVIRRERKDEKGVYWFLCKCDCGKEFLMRCTQIGKVKSCGCMTKKIIGDAQRKHNVEDNRLYGVWVSMKKRCYQKSHKSYPEYGGRGIKVCKEWLEDFTAFRDWAVDHGYKNDAEYMECTIDRVNTNGNYEPANCRWVNMKMQGNNRRSNRNLTYNGETHTISEWSNIVGIKFCTIWKRLENGWSVEDALTRRKKLWRGK